jgi:phosphoribosylanthranilate isomerase
MMSPLAGLSQHPRERLQNFYKTMKIKICGITTPEAAQRCFELGADMIGLIYYPPSPRHVDVAQIRAILDAAEPFRQTGRQTVLVVVDSLPDEIDSRFDFVQLHGTLPNIEQVQHLPCRLISVVKDFATFNELLLQNKSDFKQENPDVPQFVLEMSHGILPGGNGAAWDWSMAKPFCERYQTLLAGGITPDNVLDAIEQATPFGIDISSGVESAPGVKDFDKIKRLMRKMD